MIHIERGTAPKTFERLVKRARAEAKAFFTRAETARRQERFVFSAKVRPVLQFKTHVFALFHGKCAYCETPLEKLSSGRYKGELDWFRPKSNARNLDGTTSPDHYWWLVFEWENLYSACAFCNRGKRDMFPVEGRRVGAKDWARRGSREKHLLLDPCGDEPEDHLQFADSGQVQPLSARGEVTIELLRLNRQPLVRARRRAWKEIEKIFEFSEATGERKIEARYRELLKDEAPFAAVARQFVRDYFETKPGSPLRTLVPAPLTRPLRKRKRPSAEEARTRVRLKKADLRTLQIEKIDVRNFRSIGRLTLSFPELMDGERTPWLMLLGENATGKSSVLQAVALCLMGHKERRALGQFGVRPRDVLRRFKNGTHTAAGHVKVKLIDEPEPVELHFDSQSFRFRGKSPEPRVALMAYGSARHLPGPHHRAPGVARALRVQNLLNPFSPLTDAERWLPLLHERKAKAFDYTARALKDILMLRQRDRIRVENGRVVVHTAGGQFRFRELSDGYRTMVAMSVDIMRTLQQRFEVFESAQGLVLVDEVGAHLHPRWKMRIVGLLRHAFPFVQFLCTTHDPLCLRGLREGETVVMQRKGRGVEALTELPAVDSLRVDQLLTSEFFGLHSAMDPEIEEAFARYYQLLARDAMTRDERSEVRQLEDQLKEKDQLGSTRRQRLMLRAIDEYLAERGHAGPSRALEERIAHRLTGVLLRTP